MASPEFIHDSHGLIHQLVIPKISVEIDTSEKCSYLQNSFMFNAYVNRLQIRKHISLLVTALAFEPLIMLDLILVNLTMVLHSNCVYLINS